MMGSDEWGSVWWGGWVGVGRGGVSSQCGELGRERHAEGLGKKDGRKMSGWR